MVISLETNEMAGKTMEDTECFHVSDSPILSVKIYGVVSCSIKQSSVYDIRSV